MTNSEQPRRTEISDEVLWETLNFLSAQTRIGRNKSVRENAQRLFLELREEMWRDTP